MAPSTSSAPVSRAVGRGPARAAAPAEQAPAPPSPVQVKTALSGEQLVAAHRVAATWWRRPVALLAAGAVLWALAPALGLGGAAGTVVLTTAAAAAVGSALGGWRAQVRRQVLANAEAALSVVVGPIRLRVLWWTRHRGHRGRWLGRPARLWGWYLPENVEDDVAAWSSELARVAGLRLGGHYAVRAVDTSRCRVTLVATGAPPPPPPEQPGAPADVERAERIFRELLGPETHLEVTRGDAGEFSSLQAGFVGSARVSTSAQRVRVERVIATMLEGRWRASWDLVEDTVTFGQRPGFPESVWLPVEHADPDVDILDSYDEVEIPYGVDEDGNVLSWRPAVDPNLMLVGAPGTGKTVTAHTILVKAADFGWPVWVADGKSIEFLGFQDWPNVQVVATEVQEQVAVIHRAHEVMEYRYKLITSGKATERDFQPLLVFVDEYADFRGNLATWYEGVKVKGSPRQPQVLSLVQSIARKGRSSRVHLVFATQRPDAQYFGGDMRDNFRMRVSMGRLSPQGAMMMWENPAVGTSIPRGCRGRATTINPDNVPVEVQTYRTPDPRKVKPGSSEAELLEQLRPPVVRHERLLIREPEVEYDLDSTSDEVVEPTYRHYAQADWVLASEHPEMDPVVQRARYAGVTAPSSHMTLFGLERRSTMAAAATTGVFVDLEEDGDVDLPGAESQDVTDGRPALRLVPFQGGDGAAGGGEVDAEETGDEQASEGGGDDAGEGFDGYGPAMEVAAAHLQPGDLVLVDESADEWGTVEEEVEEDPMDPDLVLVSWRDDVDGGGGLSLPGESSLTVRRPAEVEDLR